MSSDTVSEVRFEIGHILVIDIVGYSKLLITQQRQQLETLNEIVRNTAQFRASDARGMLVRIPTGDGMALIFRDNLEAPARCALEINQALKNHPEIRLRMGIHSGPVSDVKDVNERANIAGAGMDIAQRVMDCGDAGHILLSKRVADDLAPYPQWNPYLHDLGECEVKHGVKLFLVNLYTDEIGNPQLPEKLKKAREEHPSVPTAARASAIARHKKTAIGVAIIVVALAIASTLFFVHRPPRSSVPEKSIAVLPFENLSEEKGNAYFADGIQEEILTRLSKIADLKVISRTSTQQYQSKPANLSEIAKQLGVANILEGSVQRAGDSVRVSVNLIRADSDSHLWAETYDRKLTDIFGVESEIAKAIAEQLQAKLSGRDKHELADKPTSNPAAYDAYLRGLALARRSRITLRNLLGAAKALVEAVKLDPDFAPAWAELGRVDAAINFNERDTS